MELRHPNPPVPYGQDLSWTGTIIAGGDCLLASSLLYGVYTDSPFVTPSQKWLREKARSVGGFGPLIDCTYFAWSWAPSSS